MYSFENAVRAASRMTAAALLCVGALSTASGHAAETTIRAITGLPKTHVITQDFERWVERINEKGAGIVKIKWIGGPEVTPSRKQADALSRGVFDLLSGPSSYYQGLIPHHLGLLGRNVSPMEMRKNGGMDLLSDAWEKHLNAKLLMLTLASGGYNLYLSEKPDITASGDLDLKGGKIRGNPTYKGMIEAVNGRMIVMPMTEIQTALERGLVSGLAFTSISYTDFGWARHVKYRIEPTVMALPIPTIISLTAFNKLSKEAKSLLVEQSIAHERESYQFTKEYAAREQEKARKMGIQSIELKDGARQRYVDAVYDSAWSRFEKLDPQAANALKGRLYQ